RSMLGALLAGAPAAAASAGEPPMVLGQTGYLFAGGKIDSSVPGSPMTGHMYVEYFIPKTLTHPYPIVMIHGGSQTGTNFTGTRPRRLGAVFRAARARRLRRRSGGARPLGAFLAIAGQGGGRKPRSDRA